MNAVGIGERDDLPGARLGRPIGRGIAWVASETRLGAWLGKWGPKVFPPGPVPKRQTLWAAIVGFMIGGSTGRGTLLEVGVMFALALVCVAGAKFRS